MKEVRAEGKRKDDAFIIISLREELKTWESKNSLVLDIKTSAYLVLFVSSNAGSSSLSD